MMTTVQDEEKPREYGIVCRLNGGDNDRRLGCLQLLKVDEVGM